MKSCSIVAGAGLVGSLWAIYLKRMGHEVILLEKRSDPRLVQLERGRSINLIITSRGIKALRGVGLWEEVKEITIPVYGRMMHALDGTLTYQAYGRDKECNYSVSRSELNQLLMSLAEKEGARILFESVVETADFKAKKLITKNGKAHSYDLLFGADGAGSVVRKEFAYQCENFNENIEWLGAEYKELLMPSGSQGDYPMDSRALHIWPRGSHMLMALPNLDGSFTMTAYMPTEMAQTLSDTTKIKEHFEKYYADSLPLMPDYLTQYEQNPPGKLGTVRCYPWTLEESAALLGDAAHAIVPFFGQGMNAGLEDCTALYELWEKHGGDWKQIFPAYEKAQKKNADAIATMAIENYEEMKSKVGDKNFLTRKRIEHDLEEIYPDLYKSRYGLVTYTLIPYWECFQIGLIQQEILDELMLVPDQDLRRPRVRELLLHKLGTKRL